MARSPTTSKSTNSTTAAGSPAKAAASNPAQDKFGKAFKEVGKKTFEQSPGSKKKPTIIDVDYEASTPLGTGLITFSQRGKNKQAYVYPLLVKLGGDPDDAYRTLRIYMQASLFSHGTPDRKLKISAESTINVYGLVVTFDQQNDHINEANVGKNLRKMVELLVKSANTIAHRQFNGQAKETFNYKNEFHVGNNFTRTGVNRRHLGTLISPEDSVTCIERIFPDLSLQEIVDDRDIMEGMHGNVDEGNAMVAIERPDVRPHNGQNEEEPRDDNHEEQLPSFVADP